MPLLARVLVGLVVALALPTEAKTVQELTAEYSRLGNATCSRVARFVPQLPASEAAAFMVAYQSFNGTGDEQPVLDLATGLLANKDIAAFLTVKDSFGAGGFDAYLVQCAVMTSATPLALATFGAQGAAQEVLVSKLLDDPILMRDMLLAGGAEGGKYGEAMSIYSRIVNSSALLQARLPRVNGGGGFWDDRDPHSVLHRLALGSAVAHAVPIQKRWEPSVVDPVARYVYFEAAYQAGELDPWFEVLTAFELRYSVRHDGSDEDMTWFRETEYNFRPEHIVQSDNYHLRYAMATRTDVPFKDPPRIWPDGRSSYRAIPIAGGICGPRAFFARLARRAFGLPTWGAAQPGHAAMTTWAPEGWAVLYGQHSDAWPFSYDSGVDGGDYRGPAFYLETRCREYRADYQKVLRAEWTSAALVETPVSKKWTPHAPTSYGTGGPWSALGLYLQKIATKVQAPPRTKGPSVVPTKVDAFISRWNTAEPAPSITPGPDGSIIIPAAAFKSKNASAPITVEKSAGDPGSGLQINHAAGNFLDPGSTAIEYEIDSAEGGTFFFTANFTTWHINTDLQLSTNTTTTPLEIPVFWTVGYWNETQPVEVTLLKGRNVLRFVRQLGAAIVIKEFLMLKQKPVVPSPPRNPTPAPPPPALDKYIRLAAGLACASEGMLDLNPLECGYASAYFGYKYTGTRVLPLQFGCWFLSSGPWAGNSNQNTNASAECCAPTRRSICAQR